jgi:hypothetical protein
MNHPALFFATFLVVAFGICWWPVILAKVVKPKGDTYWSATFLLALMGEIAWIAKYFLT